MDCNICKTGETAEGKTTVTLRRGTTVLVIENADAHICDNCGHYYLTSAMAKQ